MQRFWFALGCVFLAGAMIAAWMFGSLFSGAIFTARAVSQPITVQMADEFPGAEPAAKTAVPENMEITAEPTAEPPGEKKEPLPTATAATATAAPTEAPTVAATVEPPQESRPAAAVLAVEIHANGLFDYVEQAHGAAGEICIRNDGPGAAQAIRAAEPFAVALRTGDGDAEDDRSWEALDDTRLEEELALPAALDAGARVCLPYQVLFTGDPAREYRVTITVALQNGSDARGKTVFTVPAAVVPVEPAVVMPVPAATATPEPAAAEPTSVPTLPEPVQADPTATPEPPPTAIPEAATPPTGG